MLKRWGKYLIFGAVVALAAFFLIRSGNLYDKYSEVKGAYETLKTQTEAEKKELVQKIEENDKRQKELDEVIIGLEKKVAEKNNKIGQLTNEIGQLEDEFETIPTLEGKIANLQGQVALWKEQFSLAQAIIVDKDQEIFSLKEKHISQVMLTETYKKNYESETELRKLAEVRIKMSENRLRASKTWNTVKTLVIIVVAGELVHQLMK